MAATVINLRMQGLGIWADRSFRSSGFGFRRYNLIYGFNGSGKSTLSRVFASFIAGAPHPRLPTGCEFEIAMDDGSTFGWPAKASGLERRVLVFNADYIEENLQWTSGRANPVFFIGSDQANAAAELERLEARITAEKARITTAQSEVEGTSKTFAQFRRDRAKITAAHLYLGNRKYEAPSLTKDFDAWGPDETPTLSQEELAAAKEVRQRAEPMPRLSLLTFDPESAIKAFEFVAEVCGKSLITATLEEARHFPEMLMWLKEGHSFHAEHELLSCLLCGGPITQERFALLAAALDEKIDKFVAKLSNTALRLAEKVSSLAALEDAIPASDSLGAAVRPVFKNTRPDLVNAIRRTRKHLNDLQGLLAEKQKQPASAIDVSRVLVADEVARGVEALARALASANTAISQHNRDTDDFVEHKKRAEIDIRKHFIAECRQDYTSYAEAFQGAQSRLDRIEETLRGSESDAAMLRRKIAAHGPAAAVINGVIASYLGHQELTIHPVEQGYELHRHGKPISGLPSEGEKTAMAIAYFLSSIEAEGRKLKECIVVIDDPVSSLDTRALNFACALVRNRLEGAGQLFVLTHNLQCMNEFKKAWRNRSKRAEDNSGKRPTAALYFVDVKMPSGEQKRSASLVEMSRLLREYDSEYHYLFSQVLAFADDPDGYSAYGYMMPNLLRRVLDVFLAFRCPGNSGFSGQIAQLCAMNPELDKDRLVALERLAQVESHSDSLEDLLTFSAMTLEETTTAAAALLHMMEVVDSRHLQAIKRLCG